MGPERRLAPRYHWSVEIAVMGALAQTVDISANGVCFETQHQFLTGEEVPLVLPFRHARGIAQVACEGRVVRVEDRSGAYRVAVTYEPVSFAAGEG